eukprot:Colp12_sorted_trinity150504_noHs@17817
MFSYLVGRMHLVHHYSVRGIHSANRKELIPLIKQIHPDLSAHLADSIRAQNMNCIQNLNDMWDTLESNIDYATGRNQAFGIDVKFPFRSQYDLTCFISPKSETETNVKPVKISYTLNVPDSMSRKQSITQKQFSQSIQLILNQQGRMFELAGLKNPWEAAMETRSSGSPNPSMQKGKDGSIGFSSELETFIFEKWVAKNNKHNRIGALDNKHGRSDYHQMYHRDPKRRSKSASLDNLFGNNRRAQEAFFEDEADAFLRHGNVVVADLSAKDEFLAVKRLRKLLINFGDVLSFSFDRWRAVYIMLYQYGGAERYVSGALSCTGSAAESAGADDQGSDEAAEGLISVYNGGYVLETHGNQYILRVPHDFRTKHLLEFTGRELPVAQLILQ